jgi:hypothetical protein
MTMDGAYGLSGLATGLKPLAARIFWPGGERMVSASSMASGFAAFITASPYCGPIVSSGGKATMLSVASSLAKRALPEQ